MLKQFLAAGFFILFISLQSFAVIPIKKGWWKFDNPENLTAAELGFGRDLVLFGTQTAAEGPRGGNGAVKLGTGSFYNMFHGISSNGGGDFVNEYTLMFDFRVSTVEIWHSFFQTTINNDNDGDFFINQYGNIGLAAVGYSDYTIEPGQWYRLVISVKNGDHFTCYLDGNPFLSGVTQNIDGRFSLDDPLLVFADDNGEDGEIYCAELAIWDLALTPVQAHELAGYGHEVEPVIMSRIPFLQGKGDRQVTINWHDIDASSTIVKYGTDSAMSGKMEGNSEILKEPYCWHTVKLTGLEPNTRYFYKVGNGNTFSSVYSFRTLPDQSYTGRLRFLLFSDTHCPDSTAVNHVIRAARKTISDLYGPDIENHVNGIFHSGDIVVDGSILEQYTTQFFRPFSLLSPNISTMAVAGNHEGENRYFYQYMKLEDFSAFPEKPGLNEKLWSLVAGNALFIGLNSNISDDYGTEQAEWLDEKLSQAEADTVIDFVFLFMHHFPFSELWNVSDESIEWVKYSIIPVLKKYSKVRELHYGHTHGYERGTIMSDTENGDFNIICGGGGGGGLDPWNSAENHDYPEINISYSTHFFQILEIDIARGSYETKVFNIGTPGNWRNVELADLIYRKNSQPSPINPVIENVIPGQDSILIETSGYEGPDSLMSVHLQVLQISSQNKAIDTVIHWKNIFGVDLQGRPTDRGRINLNTFGINTTFLLPGNSYLFKVRFRDHNLKWSKWSPGFPVTITSSEVTIPDGRSYQLYQNFPNPFIDRTTIAYYLPERCNVNFRIYDMNSSLITSIDEGMKDRGMYTLTLINDKFNKGTYSYQMITPNTILSRKMIKR